MNLKNLVFASLFLVAGAVGLAAQSATLSYFGRASMRIVTASGFVIYIDPYASGDYSRPANLVLVTHGHDDHNAVDMVSLGPKAVVAGPPNAVSAPGSKLVKEGDEFVIDGVRVRAVAAYNKNHRRSQSVGYVITFDGITVYHAGDTDFVPEMAKLASLSIDYAFFPTDNYWNMGGAEARRCADAVKARYSCAIHSSPDGSYDKSNADALAGKDVLALAPGAALALSPAKK